MDLAPGLRIMLFFPSLTFKTPMKNCLLLFEVTFTLFLKIKSKKEVTKQ